MTPEYIASQPANVQAQLTEGTARVQAQLEQIADACQGINRDTHFPMAQHYLLAAAVGGNRHARAEFVKLPIGVVDLMRTPALGELYAANAPRLFKEMWDEGDVEAIDIVNRVSMSPGDVQIPAILAVPEELRDPQLARLLRERVMHAMLNERELAAQPPRPPGYIAPPIDPEVRARAERYWNELFEHSESVSALRQQRDAPKDSSRATWGNAPVFPECKGP